MDLRLLLNEGELDHTPEDMDDVEFSSSSVEEELSDDIMDDENDLDYEGGRVKLSSSKVNRRTRSFSSTKKQYPNVKIEKNKKSNITSSQTKQKNEKKVGCF